MDEAELIAEQHRRDKTKKYHLAECFVLYKAFVNRQIHRRLDIGKLLPSLHLRPLSPGDMMTIVADTGTSKTYLLQFLSLSVPELNVLFFEFEWSAELIAERYLAAINRTHPDEICRMAQGGGEYSTTLAGHIWIVDQSNLSVDQMRKIIIESQPPIDVVLVDYLGLVSAHGDRYERMSNVAESLKVMARDTKTVVIAVSQMPRKERGHDGTVGLHDAKGSGSIEASSQLVLGMWVDKQDPVHLRWIKVLKCNYGQPGKSVCCRFDWSKTQFTEATMDAQPDYHGHRGCYDDTRI